MVKYFIGLDFIKMKENEIKLPQEIINYILYFLDSHILLNYISLLSKKYNEITKNEEYWKLLAQRKFLINIKNEDESWNDCYKRLCMLITEFEGIATQEERDEKHSVYPMIFIIDDIDNEEFNGRILWQFKVPDIPKQTCNFSFLNNKGKLKGTIKKNENNEKEIIFRTYECDSKYICVPSEFKGI
jgi:hypothetical protein